LRTGDFENPFPEELNRALIDRFAAFCFAPTEQNRRTLLAEGIPANRIFVTGNTGIDALLIMRDRLRRIRSRRWDGFWGSASNAVQHARRPLILITAHRRESFGERMATLFGEIRNVAYRHPDWTFVYPVHLNPNVRATALDTFKGLSNVHLIGPLPYEPFVFLMERASLILTDSGGIQEEALSLGKPVIVMRETTERWEALTAGTVMLAGNTGQQLEQRVEQLLAIGPALTRRRRLPNPYGDGHAAQRILKILWNAYNSQTGGAVEP
jgi:UDP-N-acetylglucosamine 2-epimerase (non-hydrolysing)